MTDAPLNKPKAFHANQRTPLRPTSEGYKIEKGLAPEIARNQPTNIPEVEEKKEKDDKEKKGLNLNATPFYPKKTEPSKPKEQQQHQYSGNTNNNPYNKNKINNSTQYYQQMNNYHRY